MVKSRQLHLDEVFHALSDATRRGIIQRLSSRPERIVDLAAPYAMSLPAILKHVRVLETTGLVTRRREGRESTLHLRADSIDAAIAWLERYRNFWQQSFDHLEAMLREENQPKPQPKKQKPRKKT
jgi:DNA-binding transcriptional ArsR family regulator